MVKSSFNILVETVHGSVPEFGEVNQIRTFAGRGGGALFILFLPSQRLKSRTCNSGAEVLNSKPSVEWHCKPKVKVTGQTAYV